MQIILYSPLRSASGKRATLRARLRGAIREAYRVSRAGKAKWEFVVRKKGHKKLLIAYEVGTDEVFVITGAEG